MINSLPLSPLLTIKQDLILLHGWAFNSAVWQSNIDYLSNYFNIITVDLNGHGKTPFNIEHSELNNYLEYLIKKIPDNANLLGWSLGGNIALNLKYKYPKKINKLILCCSNPCFVANTTWLHGIDHNILTKFNNNLINNTAHTVKEFLLLQTMNQHQGKILYKNLLDLINNSPTASIGGLQWGLDILNQNHMPLLDKINHKDISFIFGAKDALIPKDIADYLTFNYPAMKIHLLDKAGHIPFITEQDSFHNILINSLH